MRRTLVTAALAAVLVAGSGVPAWSAPSPRSLDTGWSTEGAQLVWRSAAPVPIGDAVVEFWAGDRPLGRPVQTDLRTFRLDRGAGVPVSALSVRAGGRRLDAPPPARRKAAAEVAVPAALPANEVDPGVKGPYRTVRGAYQLPGVTLPRLPAPVEMLAEVVSPVGAPGRRPLALFLHGRHLWCYQPGSDDFFFEWPCADGSVPIPSQLGYLQAQELLASQGYVTVSIAANGISAQDNEVDEYGADARSLLIRRHLSLWADWARDRAGAPAIVRSSPVPDMSKVFLMGHSRGGEGVNRAATDSLSPPPGDTIKTRWSIRGVLHIGPTIFGQNPAPDVPSVTILPGCDGDVADLQGQMFADATRGVSSGRALHSVLFVVGANHNYFNTEWTPGQAAAPAGDDFPFEDDAVCGPSAPTRLTAAQQQAMGATYIAAAARLFVAGDDRVRPLLDGTGRRAPSAGPARVLSHAVGGARTPVLLPGPALATSGGARVCDQITRDRAAACYLFRPYIWSPHFAVFRELPDEPGRHAVRYDWTSPGTPMTVTLPAPAPLGSSRELALRLAVPENSPATTFGVTAVDSAGRRTALGDVTLSGLPADRLSAAIWAQEVRVPRHGVRDVASLVLTPRAATGTAWLIDAWGLSPGTPDPRPARLPRVDIGGLVVDEGDSGEQTYQIPVDITGDASARIRLSVVQPDGVSSVSWVADIVPGQRRIDVPVTVRGDTFYRERPEHIEVLAKAERGVTIGDYVGTTDVRNDDPQPTLSVAPIADRVAEGAALTWRFTVSAPAEDTLYLFGLWAEPPAAGAELSSADVDPRWLRDTFGLEPDPARPLSDFLGCTLEFPPGATTADFSIPTVADGVAEPDEVVTLHIYGADLPALTGTVTD
ncbi:alpha/beta hydrolase family protein [Catenuloplanes sp. NPDC051500]|uniref:alpha/beta hydrolase family protein n=1 Tax=Catenuloplanes sp. NPDC051500 TaxID=3363959 RepID=UPI003792F0B1